MEELGTDIIDGKIVDWDKMSIEELKNMKKEFKDKQKRILRDIDKELEE